MSLPWSSLVERKGDCNPGFMMVEQGWEAEYLTCCVAPAPPGEGQSLHLTHSLSVLALLLIPLSPPA